MTSKPAEIRELIKEAGELETEVMPPSSAMPPIAIPEIPIKRVFLFLLSFYFLIVAVRLVFLEGPSFIGTLRNIGKQGFQVPASPTVLYGYFIYMCVACQFFPIPTLPPIAFTAKVFHPVLVAFVGAIGTCVANLNDYVILGWLFRHNKVKKIRDISTYKKLLSFFDRYAFVTLSAASFLPIPVDVIRLLAISRAYSFLKYVAAAFVGRFPRYLIIAYLGKELPAKYILVIFLITVLPAAVKFVSDIIKKRRRA
ncbi:VTT domain-containing protein [bacterium]|nr:VTT domain-containing protein [bacterium]MCI0602011.1 VTT domain-containing protein [bacterium]